MCAVPSLELHCQNDLTKADFPELDEHRYSLENQGRVWVLTIYGGPEGCLCNDRFIGTALKSILERFSETGPCVYYPNDYRDLAMREVSCGRSDAVDRYPISLDTAPIRVKIA